MAGAAADAGQLLAERRRTVCHRGRQRRVARLVTGAPGPALSAAPRRQRRLARKPCDARRGHALGLFPREGTPAGAYIVHVEAFRTFIVNLMLDVVRRYDVDGINLDYIRAMGICTSDACKADYARKTGGNLTVDMLARIVIGDARTRIQLWQEAAVKDIVTRVSTEGRKIKPGLIISVDGHPAPPGTPPSLEGRNEVDWVKSGLINVIYKMDYGRDIDAAGTDAIRKQISVPERLITLFSNYDHREDSPREGALIAAYVEYAQRKWPGSGAAFYIYARMSDEQIHALRAGPFKEVARPYWPPLNG